jgi:hypothetical protein
MTSPESQKPKRMAGVESAALLRVKPANVGATTDTIKSKSRRKGAAKDRLIMRFDNWRPIILVEYPASVFQTKVTAAPQAD